jgi:hypothetical protein
MPNFPFNPSAKPIVYVRPVNAIDLPEDILTHLPHATQFYAIHHADGDRMAVVADRALAFVVARQNDYDPVSVH